VQGAGRSQYIGNTFRLTGPFTTAAAHAWETLPHGPKRPEDVLKVDADEDEVGGNDAAAGLRQIGASGTAEGSL
jgi:hypothetical protein